MPDTSPSVASRDAETLIADQPVAGLLESAVDRHEGLRTATSALAVQTGAFTGRSPNDKFIVDEPSSHDAIWWGTVNQRMAPEAFDRLRDDVCLHLDQASVFREDLLVGADPTFQVPVHLTTERAWVALFARHLFIVPDKEIEEIDAVRPITILHAPTFAADPRRHDSHGSTVIAIHPGERVIVIAGTEYAGEVKKSVFTLMQYILPLADVLTMHCSANVGTDGGRPTLFFGLSGTGKTTLSNDPDRLVVGDDEHAWSDRGIFNLEGGCYAKTIDLSATDEPSIYQATQHAGTVFENVAVDPDTTVPDFSDASLTENTRAAFPLSSLNNAAPDGMAGHPGQIILLTADASGVLPPVSRLTREQAATLFMLGFTSKVGGTERGVDDPELTFSPCFGAPFLMLPPDTYARMFVERIDTHRPSLWLVNTGWTGGSHATGHRISIGLTRSIVQAITSGDLDDAPTWREPAFQLAVPVAVPGVPDEALHPRNAWAQPDAYDRQAAALKAAFRAQTAEQQIDAAWSSWLTNEFNLTTATQR